FHQFRNAATLDWEPMQTRDGGAVSHKWAWRGKSANDGGVFLLPAEWPDRNGLYSHVVRSSFLFLPTPPPAIGFVLPLSLGLFRAALAANFRQWPVAFEGGIPAGKCALPLNLVLVDRLFPKAVVNNRLLLESPGRIVEPAVLLVLDDVHLRLGAAREID